MSGKLKNNNSGIRHTRKVTGKLDELVVSDIHFPFASPAAVKLTHKLVKHIKPGLLTLLGDIADNHAVSRHKKSPFERMRFAEEIKAARSDIKDLRRAGSSSEVIYLEGNHDANLQFFLDTKAEELAGLEELRLTSLLHLDALGIEFFPEGSRLKIGELNHVHGHEIAGASAKAKFSQVMVNMICGHHHRFDEYVTKDYEGKNRGVWFNGTLFAEPSYVHHDTSQLGITLVRHVKDFFEVVPIRYHEEGGVLYAVHNGRIFEEPVVKSRW